MERLDFGFSLNGCFPGWSFGLMHPTVPYRMVRSSGGIGFSPWTGLAVEVEKVDFGFWCFDRG